MSYPMSSRRSAGRSITTVAVGFVTLGLLASYGANTAAADQGSGDRIGCGTFCQNAGGYGAAGQTHPRVPVVTVGSGTVRVDADGYVPVTVTCVASSTCQGAITLSITNFSSQQVCGGGNYDWAGCSDLLVNANSTRTIAVPLTPDALEYVRANSPVTVGVNANSGQAPITNDPNSWPFGFGNLQVSAA
jgi:hypothetical protein